MYSVATGKGFHPWIVLPLLILLTVQLAYMESKNPLDYSGEEPVGLGFPKGSSLQGLSRLQLQPCWTSFHKGLPLSSSDMCLYKYHDAYFPR